MTTPQIFEALLNRDVPQARRLWIDGGGSTMQSHALAKMFRGEIDPRAVERQFGPLHSIASTIPVTSKTLVSS